jgi:hypothetical protein
MPQLATSWLTLCTIHTLILSEPQIMWYFSSSQNTLFEVNQIMLNLETLCATLYGHYSLHGNGCNLLTKIVAYN